MSTTQAHNVSFTTAASTFYTLKARASSGIDIDQNVSTTLATGGFMQLTYSGNMDVAAGKTLISDGNGGLTIEDIS